MTNQCPNCNAEFFEQRETCFHCRDCGWFKNVDGEWHSCSEPPKLVDPKPEPEPMPPEPEPPKSEEPEPEPEPAVKEYLGGLITVTVEDEDAERDD